MPKTFSLILETENLGMAGLADLETSLNSLKKQKFSVKNAKEVLIIVGSHVSRNIQQKIKQKYPWVKLHLEKGGLDYAKSKMLGAEIAKGDIVIFSDSDMNYESTWLGNMIGAFEKYPKGYIMSGDTRLKTDSSYKMALNCTWMIQILSDKIQRPEPITYFPLNNFAINRSDMLATPIPYKIPLYRNKIPLWQQMLTRSGNKIIRIPGTRGYHAPPGTFIDWLYRILIYGSDFVAMQDFSLNRKGEVIEKNNFTGKLFHVIFLFPWKIEQLILNSYKLLKEDVTRVKYLPGAICIGLANAVVAEIGAFMAIFKRDFMFKKITAHEEQHVV